jgi:hypothetical protein
VRKFATAAVLAVAATAVAVAPAHAVNATQGLDVKLSPTKAGTKDKPKATKITVTTTTTPNDTTPFGTTQAVIYFDKNIVFNGAKFKSCTAAKVQASESSCPSGSKVGTGSAVGVALGQTANLKVTAFNGPSGKSLLLHVVGSTPIAIDSVINAKLSKTTGKYGYKLTVPIPSNLQQPVPGVFATLTKFVTSVGGTSKGVPYVGLKGCTGGKLAYKGNFTFTDGSSLPATSSGTCKK